MYWYTEKGKDSDVVISSRVRYARNLRDVPFVSRLDKAGAEAVIEKVRGALDDESGWEFTDFSSLSGEQAQAYV